MFKIGNRVMLSLTHIHNTPNSIGSETFEIGDTVRIRKGWAATHGNPIKPDDIGHIIHCAGLAPCEVRFWCDPDKLYMIRYEALEKVNVQDR